MACGLSSGSLANMRTASKEGGQSLGGPSTLTRSRATHRRDGAHGRMTLLSNETKPLAGDKWPSVQPGGRPRTLGGAK